VQGGCYRPNGTELKKCLSRFSSGGGGSIQMVLPGYVPAIPTIQPTTNGRFVTRTGTTVPGSRYLGLRPTAAVVECREIAKKQSILALLLTKPSIPGDPFIIQQLPFLLNKRRAIQLIHN
jgi:hypothetical protein